MLTPHWNPDRRTLRQFSAIWLGFLFFVGLYRAWRGGAFGTDIPFGFEGPWIIPLVLWVLALGVGLPGLVAPALARPVYIGMTIVTFPIGWVVSHVLLAVVYFGLFAGFGLVFRLIGRDRLHLRFDRSASTYWKERPRRTDSSRYFRLS